MSEKGLTNISLKKINKSKVYQYIYRTADGFIHCQSESESSGAGRSY